MPAVKKAPAASKTKTTVKPAPATPNPAIASEASPVVEAAKSSPPLEKTSTPAAESPKVDAPKPEKPARAAKMKQEKPAAPAEPAKAVAEDKPARKTKVVRDSFTMPETDYALLSELKKRCLAAGVSAKKSELLRAGLQALSAMPASSLATALGALENVKTGRPAGDKKD